MNKLLLQLFLLFTLSFFIHTSSFAAIDTVIVDEANYGPPPAQSSGKDMDYHSNDIFNTPCTICSSSMIVSESFDPQQVGTSDGQPVYNPYPVDEIKSIYDWPRIFSNKSKERQLEHQGFRNVTVDLPDDRFHRYDTNNDDGASNMVNRSTPNNVLKCRRGQRLVLAVDSLYPNFNGVTINEHVAWNCGGDIQTVAQNKTGSGCTPVRLADIAHAAASEKIFYDPTIDCYTDPDPITLPKAVPNPNPLTLDAAKKLLQYNVEVTEKDSLTKGLVIYNANNPSDKNYAKPQEPIGGNAAEGGDPKLLGIQHQFIPKTQDILKHDYCQVNSKPISPNKPNPISILVRLKQIYWGWVHDVSETFTGTAIVDLYIDDRVTKGIDVDETFLNDLLPKEEQDKYQTKNPQGSTTTGKQTDTGAPITRTIFAQNLLPMNF